MEKYYIPNEDEFHIGFEYEEFIERDFEEGACEWESREFAEGQGLPDESRVKFLDKEDIEECGWEYDIEGDVNKRIAFYKEYMLFHFNDGIHVQIKKENKYTKYGTAFVGQDTLFEGTPNNKAELKKIMKQVGI